jgi:hypothetical protein
MQGVKSIKRQVSDMRVRRFPGQDSVSLVSTVAIVLQIGHIAFLYFSITIYKRLLHKLQWKQGLVENRKVRKKRERRWRRNTATESKSAI